MYQELQLHVLPFTSLDDDEFLNFITNDSLNFPCNTFFNPFDFLEDKYNSDLDVNHSYVFSNYHNIPKPEYVFLDSFCSYTTITNVTTLLSMNIRSVPKNFQPFTDLILTNPGIKCNIIGFMETRLDHDLISLYELPGYTLFTQCRSRYGGGVALYVSEDYNCAMNNELSYID